MRISRVVPAVLVALAAAVSLSAQKTTPAFTQVLPMPSPAPEGAGEPGLISDGRGHVILSWLEPAAGGVTRFRMSRFTGNTATNPVTIAQGSNFFVNWADVPSVFRAANDVLMAHWLERGGANRSASDVELAVSADAGRTWIPSGTPHRDGKEAEHGFVSFFNHPRGGVGLIWLDGREMASHGGDHMTAGPAATMLRTTQVATGAQGPRAFGDDIAVDPKV